MTRKLLHSLSRPRLPHNVLCGMSPHLRRDMGLRPCPDVPRLKLHALW